MKWWRAFSASVKSSLDALGRRVASCRDSAIIRTTAWWLETLRRFDLFRVRTKAKIDDLGRRAISFRDATTKRIRQMIRRVKEYVWERSSLFVFLGVVASLTGLLLFWIYGLMAGQNNGGKVPGVAYLVLIALVLALIGFIWNETRSRKKSDGQTPGTTSRVKWHKKIRWWGWWIIIIVVWKLMGAIILLIWPQLLPQQRVVVVERLKRPVYERPVREAMLIWKSEAWHLGFDPVNTETQRFKTMIYCSNTNGLPNEFETENEDGVHTTWKVSEGQEIGSWHQSGPPNDGYWYWETNQTATNAWSGKMIGEDGKREDPDSWVAMRLEVIQKP